MKKVFLFAALVAASFTTMAQKDSDIRGLNFNAGVDLSLPIGDMGDLYSFGFGVDVLGQYGFTDNLAVTLDAGYLSYSGKSISGVKIKSLGVIPFRAGVRYYPTSDIYLGAKAGLGFFTGDNSTTTTAYSFGAGYKFTSKFDAGLSYDGYSKSGATNSAITLRVGYFFGGKK